MSKHIGYLIDGVRVLCVNCNNDPGPDDCRLYDVNVAPYKQSCHGCGTLIQAGQTPAWCELFDNPDTEGIDHAR